MKQRIRHNPFNRYSVIIVGIVLIIITAYIILIVSPTKLGNDTKVIQKEITKPIITPKTGQKPDPVTETPVAPTVETIQQPDYSLPPENNGLSPVVYKVSTDQNVVFLGLDDGAFKDQSVIDIMRKNNIKASLFLSKAFIASNPDFFKQLVDLGSVVENHTLTHDLNMVKDQTYDQQKNEICGMSDYVTEHYGRRPILFRPPGGAYSDTMRQAAADCGMKAVVTWIAKANGGSMQYQVGDKLRPGDVVLMHFRPEFAQDMQAFVNAMNAAGLHTALLEDAL
jgi:peptidoglycan/xylan/chitin deacetylase (PgdA/CDA1 family)